MAKLCLNIHDYFTEDILKILFSKKINTTIDFLEYDVKTLSKITNITYKEILDIKKHILSKFSAKIQYGDIYYEHLLNTSTITPTQIKNFDKLIGGGLSNGSIYEICGFMATGKTQFCLTLALNISQYSRRVVYYIDTKRDFSSKKIQKMLETRKCSEEDIPEILHRIKVKQINDEHQLIASLYDIKNELQNIKCPLIIIDSLPAIFYHTGNHSTSLTTMNYAVNTMRLISVELSTSFLVTNIMIKDTISQNTNTVKSTIVKPGLGSYWSTIPTSRILIEKCDRNICRMTVLKSSTIECNKMCDVTIDDIGII